MSSSLIWSATLDARYACTVDRIDGSSGTLKVTDTHTNTILLEERVSLSYGAMFGPDVDDVQSWQEKIMQCVDAL